MSHSGCNADQTVYNDRYSSHMRLGAFYIGHFGVDMPRKTRTYSRLTQQALILMGQQIKLARKTRRLSEIELAERVGIARSTLQRIEKGDPLVEIGLVFEAATLTGVALFEPDATSLAPHIERLSDKLALLPKSIRRRHAADDDF
jgi:transcriptional regulator with XRE-family HTH domain